MLSHIDVSRTTWIIPKYIILIGSKNNGILLKYINVLFVVVGFCLGVITSVILVSLLFLFSTTIHCMSLLVNNVCFYWYYIASGFRSLSHH